MTAPLVILGSFFFELSVEEYISYETIEKFQQRKKDSQLKVISSLLFSIWSNNEIFIPLMEVNIP